MLGLGRGYGGPEPGTNPITVQQKIVYTAAPDSGLSRRGNADPFFGGTLDSDNMRILRGEPTVMEQRLAQLTIGAITRETQLFVFSCLNQYGKKSMTKAKIVDSLTWGGFAGNDSMEDHDTGDTDRRVFPVFLGGSFTITNNGPDTWFTGDLIFWDIPDNDVEALSIGRLMGRHHKARPLSSERRNIILRKYDPKKQGMIKESIRVSNDSEDLLALRRRAVGEVEQYSKGHVDFIDALKKVFLLGAISQLTGRLRLDMETSSFFAEIKALDAEIEEMSKIIGLQFNGGVNDRNKGFHEAFLAMLMPENQDERMYDPQKGRANPTSLSGFDPGERVLKQIQGGGGGVPSTDLKEANVVEHLLASMAETQHGITSRIVGRCISSSKSGGDTDIISFSM